ncbi:MAG: hypothetical protein GDA48_07675 [Hormoscilla sp. GM102CHS1]|nr:hypothetical protein [Hormoscilla sp. GM102CHS1]
MSFIYYNLIPRLCQAFGNISTKPNHSDAVAVELLPVLEENCRSRQIHCHAFPAKIGYK